MVVAGEDGGGVVFAVGADDVNAVARMFVGVSSDKLGEEMTERLSSSLLLSTTRARFTCEEEFIYL